MLKTIVVTLTAPTLMLIFLIYTVLKTKYPGKGIKMTNPFKEKFSLSEALELLEQGKRIRRIEDHHGYVKVTTEAAGYKHQYYADYRVSDFKPNNERKPHFSMEDVLAKDWVIDE